MLADFVQLAPNRFASVMFDESDDTVVGVTLSGPTHTKTDASNASNPGTARAIVEKKVAGLTGDLACQQVGGPAVLIPTLLNGTGQWTGEVRHPGPRTTGTWRLVIE